MEVSIQSTQSLAGELLLQSGLDLSPNAREQVVLRVLRPPPQGT